MTFKQATKLIAPVYDELKKISNDHDEIVTQLSGIYQQLLQQSNEPYSERPSDNYLELCAQIIEVIEDRVIPAARGLSAGVKNISAVVNAINFDVQDSSVIYS